MPCRRVKVIYRFWNAAGSVEDMKYYYYVAEALSAKAAIVVKQDLPDAVRGRSPQGRGSVNMSDVRQRQDADFVSFESAAQGILRRHPQDRPGQCARAAKWVLYATRCVPAGQPVTDGDIDRFVRQAEFGVVDFMSSGGERLARS